MPDLLRRLRDAVWTPTATSMRSLALASVIANVAIMVTGATVRLTKSGLGCSEWPRCTPDSFLPVEFGAQPLIEFGNRVLGALVGLIALATFIAAVRLSPRRKSLIRLSAIVLAGVAVQAGVGGATVLKQLHPAFVSMHFLLSIGWTLAAAMALYMRSREGDGPIRSLVHRDIRRLAFVFIGALFVLLAAGTVVTGSGPHSGEVTEVPRFEFGIELVARVHADLVWVVVGLTLALLFSLHVTNAPGRARRAALILLALEISQGAIGYVQYFTGVPEVLVGLHVLGSALVWIAALRVVYLLRDRTAVPRDPETPALEAAA